MAGPEQEDIYLEERGVVFRATAGLDWRLAPVFSVGPWAAYERVVPITGCVEISIPVDPNGGPMQNPQQSIPNTCGGSTIQAHGYGVVSGGLALKLTVDPWPRERRRGCLRPPPTRSIPVRARSRDARSSKV
jgi:hypothetical protein